MRRFWVGAFAFLASAMFVVSASSQPPEGKKDGPDGKKGGPPPRFALGKVLPPHVAEALDLTEEQQTKIAELEKKVRAELEKILTPEQIKKAESVGPPPKKDGPPFGKENKDGPPPKKDE